jgi:hypothetical protein
VLSVRVMGVPVGYRASDPEVLEAVRAHFPEDGSGVDAAAVEISLEIGDGGRPQVARRRDIPHVEMPAPDRLLIGGRGIEAVADARAGRAHAKIPRDALADAELFGAGILDTLTLFLVTARDRIPVHAAAVVREGRALLLAAPGGTGKSTLTYALSRAGCEVLADDAVYLEGQAEPAVWAIGRRICLPPDARARFPELRACAPMRRMDGREKVLLPLPRPAWNRTSGLAPGGVCLLDRGEVPGVERLDAEEAVDSLVRGLEPGFDRFAAVVEEPLRAVAEQGAWRVRLPADVAAVVELVLGLSH